MVSQIHCGENNSEFILSKNLPTSLTRPGTLTYDVIFQSYTGNAVCFQKTYTASQEGLNTQTSPSGSVWPRLTKAAGGEDSHQGICAI